jgi:ubiquinone/menaquinone biosynthesis C-methylase UbiE
MSREHTSQAFAHSPPENYQRYFVPAIGHPLAQDLLREASLAPGERVLDVGCGTGVVTRLAAERVGADGMVIGLDINPGMLAVAEASSPAHTIEWRQASADSIPYPDDTFDVVLCQLSLQFMPDRARALQEMRRVLVPQGRLVISVPGPAGPLFSSLAAAMEQHVTPEAAGFVNAVFGLHDTGEIEGLLERAGFRDVLARAYTRELFLPAARDFLWQYIQSTPLAGAVAAAGAQSRSAMERQVLADWSEHEHGDGLTYRQRIVMASGVA